MRNLVWALLSVFLLILFHPRTAVADNSCPAEWTACGRFVNRPPGIHQDEPPEDIQCCEQGDRVLWTIQNPDIRKFSTEYPMIQFQPGDEIRVGVEGCAQAGHRSKPTGSTWRLYASPRGDSAELYYYALIQIPGVTPGFYKIASARNASPLWVPADIHRYLAPEDVILKLGYEDNDYGDNGYWGRPGDPASGTGRGGDGDGEGGQCKGARNAMVQIWIKRNQLAPSLGRYLAFDLLWDRVDPNGLPLNPEFKAQVTRRLNSMGSEGSPFDFPNRWGDPRTDPESCRTIATDGNPWNHEQNLFDWKDHSGTDYFPNIWGAVDVAKFTLSLPVVSGGSPINPIVGLLLNRGVDFLSGSQQAAINAAALIPSPLNLLPIPFNVRQSPDRSKGVHHPCTRTEPMVDHVYAKYGGDPSLRNMSVEAVSYNFGAKIGSAPHIHLGDATVAGYATMHEFGDLTQFGASCILFGRECDFSFGILPSNSGFRTTTSPLDRCPGCPAEEGGSPGIHAELDIRLTADRLEAFARALPPDAYASWSNTSWWARFIRDSAPIHYSNHADRMKCRRRTGREGCEKGTDWRDQHEMVDGKYAIVTGSLDFDCAHPSNCGSELHPAYAWFLHHKDDPADDRWAFVLHNTGNTGARSKKSFSLNLPMTASGQQRYRVFLPQPNATGTPTVTLEHFLSDRVSYNGFRETVVDGIRGIVAEFLIDPPAKSGRHDVKTYYAPHFGGNIWLRDKFDYFGNEAYIWPLDLEYGPVGFGELHIKWTRNDSSYPGRGLSENVRRVDAGPFHTCAIVPSSRTLGGRVRCWGDNRFGQLGDGSTRSRELASTVATESGGPLEGIVQLSAGGDCTDSAPGGCTVASADYQAHTCAVGAEQDVYCWGSNAYGQLGDPTFTGSYSAVPRRVPLEAVQVAAGGAHTCARTRDGKVVCWGRNRRGQVTNVADEILRFPTPVTTNPAIQSATDVSAGAEHSCAVSRPGGMREGKLPSVSKPPETVCWGWNADSQTAYSDRAYFSDRIKDSFLFYPRKVAAGWRHTGQIAPNSPYESYGWSPLQTWGRNLEFQLGVDPFISRMYRGTVTDRVQFIPFDGQPRDLSAGWTHSCAVDDRFRLHCWGSDVDFGALPPVEVPSLVKLARADLRTPKAIEVTTGLRHTCATVATSESPNDLDWRFTRVICLGDNSTGQLGDGTRNKSSSGVDVLFPQGTPKLLPFGRLDTGADHACAVVGDVGSSGEAGLTGRVRCWGDNAQGQLGTGTIGGDSPSALAEVVLWNTSPAAPLHGIVQISAGGDSGGTEASGHTCALTDRGQVYCWGSNRYGQLGHAGRPDAVAAAAAFDAAPFDPCPSGSETCEHRYDAPVQISAGGYHTCVVTKDRKLYCWGRNDQGQLGIRRDDGSYVKGPPVKTPTLTASGVSQVAAGLMHTCAQFDAYGTRCWGLDEDGRLGGGAVPASGVSGTSRRIWIEAGARHSGRFDDNGSPDGRKLELWGDNRSKQLGVPAAGAMAATPVELRLPSASASAAFTLGWTHSCALDDRLRLHCAGSGVAMGDGTSDSDVPKPINPSVELSGVRDVKLGDLGVLEVRAGRTHTCAVVWSLPGRLQTDWRDTAVVCWGENDKGQLGDTTHTPRATPVEVRFR